MHYKEIELATVVKDEVEEDLEEVEDWWYAITIKNHYTMQVNFHSHL
jgi:predicted DNA-binding protein